MKDIPIIKRICLLLIIAAMMVCVTGALGEGIHRELVITQAGSAMWRMMDYMGMNENLNLQLNRNDDCTPAWVAQQILAHNDTIDLFGVRSSYNGYKELIQKDLCKNLADEEVLLGYFSKIDPVLLDAISNNDQIYIVPEYLIWGSNSVLACDKTHPLYERYHLSERCNAEDILDMTLDLRDHGELDEWWLWADHWDADHLYNLCILGSVNYLEAIGRHIDLESERYQSFFRKYDEAREALSRRTDPGSTVKPLFYNINFGSAYLDNEVSMMQDEIELHTTAPLAEQEPRLMLTINGYVLNPNAPNHEEAVKYLAYLMDIYSERDEMFLFPERAEPIPDPYADLTGQDWLLSPGVVVWYKEARKNCIANATDLMDRFLDNGGIQLERKYLEGMITTEQYIHELNEKIRMVQMEEK